MKMASVLLVCSLAIAARSSPVCAAQTSAKGPGPAPQKAQEGTAAPADNAAPKSALVGPTPTSSLALKTVAVMLPKYHLSQRPLDDEIGRRWLRNFLKVLDPKKSFFTQSDIDHFLSRQDMLDEMATQGDLTFAYEVFAILLKRMDEFTTLAAQLIRDPVDFTRDEEIAVDFDSEKYAANSTAAREIWRKQIKFDLLQEKIAGVGLDDARNKVLHRYRNSRRQMLESNDDELLEAFLTALAQAYDPSSRYMSAKKWEESASSVSQQIEGVGIQMQKIDDETVVLRVVPGGPAFKEGRVKPGDRIVGVGQGETGPIVDVIGMRLTDVTRQMRGKGGSVCRLQVVPKGRSDRTLVNIVRGKVQLQEVRGAVIERGQKPDGKPLRVGYLNVPGLYASRAARAQAKTSTRDARNLLEDPDHGFRSAGVDIVILDLRTNGGGTVGEAVSLPGLFIGSGPVAQVKGSDRNVRHFDSKEILAAWDGPMVILTSFNTGSGAELLAAALKDYGRALLVGDPATAGNGTIQTLLEVGTEVSPNADAPKLGALQVTTQQFYRVNGDSTQMQGVAPDLILPSLTEQMKSGESLSSPALPFDRVAPIEHGNSGTLSAEQKTQLGTLSERRREQSPEFRKLAGDVARLNARRTRKTTSLNEAKAREEGRSVEDSSQQLKDDRLFEANFYNDEILAITRDYLQAVKANK
jgi:carboxyl-terminal processing protease